MLEVESPDGSLLAVLDKKSGELALWDGQSLESTRPLHTMRIPLIAAASAVAMEFSRSHYELIIRLRRAGGILRLDLNSKTIVDSDRLDSDIYGAIFTSGLDDGVGGKQLAKLAAAWIQSEDISKTDATTTVNGIDKGDENEEERLRRIALAWEQQEAEDPLSRIRGTSLIATPSPSALAICPLLPQQQGREKLHPSDQKESKRQPKAQLGSFDSAFEESYIKFTRRLRTEQVLILT
ncbi:hypothetical protein AAMO2058_000675300 [Amorphochlora amoebiformis]